MSIKALGLRAYTLLFLGLGVLVLAALGWHMLDRLRAIEQAQQQEGAAAAELEFERAVENTLAQVSALSEQIASWDEVRQQLATPTYYTYWRDNRATAQGLWPVYVRGVELYNAQGGLLSGMRANLPPQLPAGQEAQMVVTTDARLCMLRFAEVMEPGEDLRNVLGHVGLRVDFVSALRNLHRFAYLDPDSLAINSGYEGVYPPSMAVEMIDYRSRQAAWVSVLPGLVRETLAQFMLAFLMLVALHYLLVMQLFTQPLRRLRNELEHLRGGGTATHVPLEWMPVRELIEVREALHDYRRSLEQAHHALDQSNAKLWREAHIDALTGVFNRRAFDKDWAELQRCENDAPLALILLDCDFFKSINDSYGHETGDRVLREIARLVSSELRHDEPLYRLGGDEFLIMLRDIHVEQALHIAERCRLAVSAATPESLGIRERLRISAGVVASENPCVDLPDLLRRADIAMYQAKRGVGDDKVVLFGKTLDIDQGLWSSRIVYAVLEAAANGAGIAMHYQPVVASGSGKIAYYEALARIVDAEGVIEPDDIFRVAARRRLQTPLDLAILGCVLADLEAGLLPLGSGVAINLDGSSIADPEVVRAIDALLPYLVQYKVVLEITETSLISRFEHLNLVLARYRSLGLLIALDDFGSGYSSLRYLARMPVDIVKLDRSLIEAYHQDQGAHNMVVHVVEMLRDGGFEVVAEGIADEVQRDDFAKLGVGYMQGWLFGQAERPPARG
ncbi:MAG TPA: bifunctional diguanylate cyclase/phosphodiesterase [bacterium]|nr:bifunctional diguanylate cyclase/phosphodiesterase [bacterium]